jgi:heat shock protein HslJ
MAARLMATVRRNSAGSAQARGMSKMVPALAGLLLTGTAPAAAQPAGTYRAHGTEPFWSLTITPRRIHYEAPGERSFSIPTPRLSHPRSTGRTYIALGMVVAIRTTPCNDGMSDRVYADEVTVRIGRRILHGCGGRYVEAVELTNSNWRIAAIDGRAVDGDFHLDFTEDRVTGRAGCNSFGAAYQIQENRITTGPIMSTRMACPGRMQDEQTVLRILRAPVAVRQPSEDMLELRNAAGRISLRRVPGARPRR